LPILNIFVPQVGHTPWVAGLPFFMVTFLAPFEIIDANVELCQWFVTPKGLFMTPK
jgi:hypothetical protein